MKWLEKLSDVVETILALLVIAIIIGFAIFGIYEMFIVIVWQAATWHLKMGICALVLVVSFFGLVAKDWF